MSWTSQQPSLGTSTAGVAQSNSRIPAASRSGAASRLPSPPVSPGLSSPATPPGTTTGLYAAAANGLNSTGGGAGASLGGGVGSIPSGSNTWTAGMLAQARERLASSGSATSLAAVAAAAAASGGGMATAATASGGGGGPRSGYASPSLVAPRPNSARSSSSGIAVPRPPTFATVSAGGGAGGIATPAAVGVSGAVLLDADPAFTGASGGGGANFDFASGGGALSPLNGSLGGPGAGGRSSIQVAVRVRPLCDKERLRGDRVSWAADPEGNVGLMDAASGTFTAKHRFDTVFGPSAANSDVAATVALPLVAPALVGINGTIFAYGVTSSGKTHTMMGTEADPGIVPRVIRELFAQIAVAASSSPALSPSGAAPRSFAVRLSIMEIYNEVLNDLLDPLKTNLKVREDARSGLVLVEGLTEVPVMSAEQALELISRGDHNRKVSATAFNEDSSRSHTITRIVVDSSASGGPAASPGTGSGAPSGGRRTTACLSLIDLAGSESARAVMSKGQRMEGSFINRSLLTLGTVIHKLAVAGASGGAGAGHVPFRDSKLTRLLQPSLSGPGARVAVVCNVTPAAAQTDETANTLKFAARAKLVQVTARTNEVLDERTLLRRYQKEVAELKRQLAEARRMLAAAGIAAAGAVGANGNGAAGSSSGGGGGFPLPLPGLLDDGVGAGASAALALQAERDARRVAEMESMALRIKLERLQAFLEERGVNVDDLFLFSDAASGLDNSSNDPQPLAVPDAITASPRPGAGLGLDLSLLDPASGSGPTSHPLQSPVSPSRGTPPSHARRSSIPTTPTGASLLPRSAPYSPSRAAAAASVSPKAGSAGGGAASLFGATGGETRSSPPVRAMRHASSTPRLSSPTAAAAAAAVAAVPVSPVSGTGTGPSSRVGPGPVSGSASGRSSAGGGDGSRDAAAAGSAPQTLYSEFSISLKDRGSEAAAAVRGAGAAGVAVAAGSGAVGSGGGRGPASRCGSGPSRSQSYGSDIDGDILEDDDLNEGLMAQIRDMISEAQLATPAPQQQQQQTPAAAGPQQPSRARPAAAAAATAVATAAAAPAAVLPPPGPSSGGGGAAVAAGGGGSRFASVGSYAGPSSGGGGLQAYGGGGGGGGPGSISSVCRRSTTLSTTSSGSGSPDGDFDLELQLQVLNADREVLYDQLLASEKDNERLTAQITDLRRQLGTYEQLTRQAAGELSEIRRLKEAFQARLQRENEALKAQLAQLGVTPAVPPAGASAGSGIPAPGHPHLRPGGAGGPGSLQSQQQQHLLHLQNLQHNLQQQLKYQQQQAAAAATGVAPAGSKSLPPPHPGAVVRSHTAGGGSPSSGPLAAGSSCLSDAGVQTHQPQPRHGIPYSPAPFGSPAAPFHHNQHLHHHQRSASALPTAPGTVPLPEGFNPGGMAASRDGGPLGNGAAAAAFLLAGGAGAMVATDAMSEGSGSAAGLLLEDSDSLVRSSLQDMPSFALSPRSPSLCSGVPSSNPSPSPALAAAAAASVAGAGAGAGGEGGSGSSGVAGGAGGGAYSGAAAGEVVARLQQNLLARMQAREAGAAQSPSP